MRRMIRVVMLAGGLAMLAAGIAAAADKPAPDPGEQIKNGAIQVGQGIKQGAINLWEATKSVFSSAADKLGGAGKESGAPAGKAPQSPPEK